MKTFISIVLLMILMSGCTVIPIKPFGYGEEVRIKIIDTKMIADPDCNCVLGTNTCNLWNSVPVTIVQDDKGRSDKWCGWYGPTGYEFQGIYMRTLAHQLHMK